MSERRTQGCGYIFPRLAASGAGVVVVALFEPASEAGLSSIWGKRSRADYRWCAWHASVGLVTAVGSGWRT